MFAMLKPFDEREDPSLSANAIAGKLMHKFSHIPDGFIGIFPPPPVPWLGATGGFKLQIEDRAELGFEAMTKVQSEIMSKAMQTPELANMLASFQTNAPQLQVDIDRVKAKSMGYRSPTSLKRCKLTSARFTSMISTDLAVRRVMAQADAPFRMQQEDIGLLKVRNAKGEMIPLSAFVTIMRQSGPDRIIHYNGFPR